MLATIAARRQYNNRGYCIVRRFWTEDELGSLERRVDRIYRQWVSLPNAIAPALVNMHSLTHPTYFAGNSDERIAFFAAIAPPKLTRLLVEVFGSELYFHNTQLFFNPADRHTQPAWHRDLQYSPIDDATQAQAQPHLQLLHVRTPFVPEIGIEIVPYTHQRWDSALERQVRYALNGHTNYEELPGAEAIALERGDMMVFDAQAIHCGQYARNPTRKALALCVGKPHPLVADLLDPQVLPTAAELAALSRMGNAAWYQRARLLAIAQSPRN